jgi:hypothetical protein
MSLCGGMGIAPEGSRAKVPGQGQRPPKGWSWCFFYPKTSIETSMETFCMYCDWNDCMYVCHDLRHANNVKMKSPILINFFCFVHLHQGYIWGKADHEIRWSSRSILRLSPGKVQKHRYLKHGWSDVDDLSFSLCAFIRANFVVKVPTNLLIVKVIFKVICMENTEMHITETRDVWFSWTF